jgi:hypothetical protein
VLENRIREVQFWALGFSRNRRKGYAVENLAGGLKTERVRYKLPLAREVKMEIPVNTNWNGYFYMQVSWPMLQG